MPDPTRVSSVAGRQRVRVWRRGKVNPRAPHRVVRYVFELASQFHSYYKAERVLTEDPVETAAKLALFLALKGTFANALRLIGVEAPERM